jgi:hypothetical protein
MNREPPSPHDERMEREWALQERAVRAERLGLDDSDDQALRRYRAVAQVLRQPLDENLPPDFASKMATEVRRRTAGDMRLELYVSLALLGVLVGMLVGAVVRYASILMPLALSQPWLLAMAGVLMLLAASRMISIPPHHSNEDHT